MQDRFKFRAWVYPKEYQEGYFTYFDIYDVANIEDDDTNVVQQCTGLKDNTGKLIYEGDIVKFSSIYGHGIFKIKWSDELATFGYEDKDTDFSELGRLYQEAAYVEIIGNIYENPELLEDK